jgi:hypothetical protein
MPRKSLVSKRSASTSSSSSVAEPMVHLSVDHQEAPTTHVIDGSLLNTFHKASI